MIKHIVCYKLKDNSNEKRENTKKILMSLKDNVDEIVDIKVGVDFLSSERSYDIVLEVVFNSIEDMEIYQKNKYHQEVVKKYMHEARQSSISVDYIID